jgi:diguanylate cyclase (GGDEF)-like protein/PAS domain S-box-containing protein
MRVADISHPDEIEENLDTIGRLLAGTLDSHLAERRLIRSDGGVCWVRRSLYVVRDADGKPAFLSADVTDITELREAEAARLRAENRTRALVDNTSEVIVILEPDGRWRWSNLAFTHILGYDHDQDPAPDGTVLDLIHPEDLANATEGIRRLIEGRADPNRVRTVRVRTRDGSWRRLAFHSRNLVDDPAVGGVVLFGHDVTDEHDARQRVAQLYEVFENSGEVVFLSDRAGRATYANKAARELFGLSEGSDLLADGAALLTPSSQERLRTEALPELRHAGTWGGQLTVFTTTGETFALAIRIHLHRDDDGAVVLVSGIAHDICDLVEAQKLLEHQATHDPLTGLSNRNLFQELGEQALARAERDGTTVAVLYLDLDHFKRVNDSRGHPIGDRLLQEIAQRLRDCVRRGDVIARFGGDEFVVLCEHPAGESEMAHLANRIIDALALPARIDEHEVRTGASIGIALGAGSRVTIDALLRDADAALYQAKDEGRGRAVRFGAPPAEQ